MQKIYKLVILGIFVGVFAACGGDDNPTPSPIVEESEPDKISTFIWSAMDAWYLWENEISPLSMTKETGVWKKYLSGYGTDYEGLFNSLIYERGEVDKWSWITDDYGRQGDAFAGIGESFGYAYRLSRYKRNGREDGILGYVTYIIPDSPASASELKRGDIFISVDGEDITISNYKKLLFTKKTYELGLAELSENSLTPSSKKVKLTAVKLTENPIHMAKVISLDNGTKVGYMVYNGFTGTNEFNVALNDSIGKLRDAGVTEMVLDLRYNGGGSIYSAIILSSMLDGGKNLNKVLTRSNYNASTEKYYRERFGDKHFTDNITSAVYEFIYDENGNYKGAKYAAKTNYLQLNKIYFLVSDRTASASEMTINSLRPYTETIVIGDTTAGKYYGSRTLYDSGESDRFQGDKKTINPEHKWALQPLIMKITNAEGQSYEGGLLPAYLRDEWDYLEDIKPLGDVEEPLLKAALMSIKGENVPFSEQMITRNSSRYNKFEERQTLFDSQDLKKNSGKMFYDDVQNLKKSH